jgi:hypothetical protein
MKCKIWVTSSGTKMVFSYVKIGEDVQKFECRDKNSDIDTYRRYV